MIWWHYGIWHLAEGSCCWNFYGPDSIFDFVASSEVLQQATSRGDYYRAALLLLGNWHCSLSFFLLTAGAVRYAMLVNLWTVKRGAIKKRQENMRNTAAQSTATATPAETRRMGSQSSGQVAFPFTARACCQLNRKKKNKPKIYNI